MNSHLQKIWETEHKKLIKFPFNVISPLIGIQVLLIQPVEKQGFPTKTDFLKVMHTQHSNKIAMMQLFIALTCSFGCSLVEASILAKTRLSKPLKCLANFSTCLLVVSQLMHHGVCTCFPTVNLRSFEETIELFFFFFF